MKTLTLFLIWTLLLTSCSDKKQTDDVAQDNSDSLVTLLKQSQTTIDSLRKALRGQDVRFSSIEFLSTGELIETDVTNGSYGHRFRVEIRQSEIYRSLYVSQLDYFGESQSKVTGTIKIDIEKEVGISSEGTSSLEFMQWITPNYFEVKIRDKIYDLHILDIQNIKLTEKK